MNLHTTAAMYMLICQNLSLSYRASGLDVKFYRYYDPSTCGFDAVGAYEDLSVSTYECHCVYHSHRNAMNSLYPEDLRRTCLRAIVFIVYCVGQLIWDGLWL